MSVKGFLPYTNPITIIMGIPLLCGIVLAVITHNIVRNTAEVVKSTAEDIMDKQ